MEQRKMESNQNALSNLPNDVLLHIIDFLDPKEVNSLMTTSKVFLQLISSEYKLSFPLYPVKDFNITWLDSYYWSIQECASSPFGRAATLKYVWWLDVRKCFTKVSPGNYKVFCRVRLGNAIGRLDAVNVTITSKNKSSKKQEKKHFVVYLKNKPKREWFFLPLGEITLESCSDLDVAFYNHHTYTIKRELEVDFVSFVKASSGKGMFFEEIEFMQRLFG